jgi:hypothetical protein
MTFSERMKEIVDQGLTASKEFAVKAGAKAQELGEKGILKLEIKQLESQAQKIIGRLGTETYRNFVDRNEETISRDAPEIKTILGELAAVRESLDRKELELKNK